MMKKAIAIDLDNDFIYNLHANFDQTSKRFVFAADAFAEKGHHHPHENTNKWSK